MKNFTEIIDFTSRRRDGAIMDQRLSWWSKKTEEEPHMLTLSVDNLNNTLLMAGFIFGSENNELIAAGGIFLPRTHNNNEPYLDGKKVVEIGTNYVLPEYRSNGIGGQLVELRLKFAWERKWVPVSVSSNPVVQNLFIKFGGTLMENYEEYSELRELLCLKTCKKEGELCNACPLVPNCGWIFKQPVN